MKKGTIAAVLKVSRWLERQGLDAFEILLLASWAEEEIQRLRKGGTSQVPLYLFSPARAGHLARLKYLRTIRDSGPAPPLVTGEASSFLNKNPRIIESVRIRRLLHDSTGLADVCAAEERKLIRRVRQLSRALVDPNAATEVSALMEIGMTEEQATNAVAKKYGRSVGGLRMRRSRIRKESGKGRPFKRRGPR